MLFESYRFSNKLSFDHFMHACYLGGVTVIFSLLVLLSVRPADRIPPWAVLGLAGGLALILAGAFGLHRVTPRSRLGCFLKHHSDRWFPVFLFCVRIFFLISFAILLWVTLQHLGLPSSWTINSLFALLLVIVPLKGILRECLSQNHTEKREILNDFSRYFMTAVSALLIVLVLTSLSENPVSANSLDMIDIFLWIFAILIVTTCLILFLGRLPHHRPHPSKKQKRTQPLFARNNNKPEY